MNYKELIEQLKEWDEYFISEACGRRDLKCEDYCTVVGKDCLVIQSITAIQTLLAERDAAVAELERVEEFTESEFLGYLNNTIHAECGYEFYLALFDLLCQVTHWEYDETWRGTAPDRKTES